MAPRDATRDDWMAWQHETRTEAARTAQLLEPHDAALAAQVAAYAASAPEEPPAGSLGLLTRIHGDYHLGQLLDTDRGWVILDFEGEPARPLAERITLNHPLIDVAGMLRSWDYAAHTAGRDNPAREAWLGAVSQAFRDAYWREAGAASTRFLPGPAARDALLRHFILRKALYELRYELGSRPDWLSIPAAAVRSMLE
ncbi:MAG: hypothetical protein U5Q44_16585 [Dehalococcoidia bacterium]|nr:hypothetical protein [Dehalococcoidia bacterium]